MPLSNDDLQAIMTELGRRGAKLGTGACADCGQGPVTIDPNVRFVPALAFDTPEGNSVDFSNGRGYLVARCKQCTLTKFYDVGDLGFTGPGTLGDVGGAASPADQ